MKFRRDGFERPASEQLASTPGLYGANTLARFWGIDHADVSAEQWAAAAAAAVDRLLPGASELLAQRGWSGLMEHILGEAQFGPDRYRLSHARRIYYQLRPVLPRRLIAVARGALSKRAHAFRLGWPIEDRYVRFMHEVLNRVAAGRLELQATARSRLWPGGAPFAFVLTHDVERADGQAFVRRVADLDERYGFHAAFNFVPEDYPVDRVLLRELQMRGCEVGLHGLKHDGKLFSSWSRFIQANDRIHDQLQAFDAVGFRSPATHRNPAWMQHLPIEYDSSFFDTDPYEVMPGGTMSIWPFFCGRFIELPYTLPQDHTLMTVLGERTPRLWVDKVEFIARSGGMALLNAHPDYLRSPTYWSVYEEFLQHMSVLSRASEATQGGSGLWHALPRDVARWWRARNPAAWTPDAAGGQQASDWTTVDSIVGRA